MTIRERALATTSEPRGGAPQQRSRVAAVLAWVGIALHLPVGFFYLSSGLLAPLWALVVLFSWWIALLYFALRERRRRPWWSLATPLIAFLTWFAFLSFGEAVLGWQA